MRILAIETASEACSIALFEGGSLLAHDHRVLGRGHAEALVPMIADLPDKGRADRIYVSLGPGSFTGVRIGIAAARALGIAWGADVLGYPTLALVAAQAAGLAKGQTCENSPLSLTVCMNGGHGEWFVQDFADGAAGELQSLTPQAARDACRQDIIAGNRADELADLFADGEKTPLSFLPDARAALLLNEALLSDDLSPRYGREPDAVPQKVAKP